MKDPKSFNILSGNVSFLKYFKDDVKENSTKECFQLIQSFTRRTNVLTRCRIPKLWERYKIDSGIFDLKSKRILLRSAKEKYMFIPSK